MVKESIKDLTEPRSIYELPPQRWCKLRKWAADNVYSIILVIFFFVVTWLVIIASAFYEVSHK